MKRFIAFFIVAVLLACCGCSKTSQKLTVGTDKADLARYTIAMNPSVMMADGEVDSIRNEAAASMSSDIKAKQTDSLYKNTLWKWLFRDENGEWNRREVRELSQWTNGKSAVNKGMPYAYKFDDSGISSLMVYDSTKIDIDGVKENDLPTSGIALSFTDGKEEAISYTAIEDGEIVFSDRDGGNIAIVKSVAGINTSFLDENGAKSAVVVRVYKNNRIYWQQILNSSTSAVPFPQFDSIKLKKGDTIIISAEATDSVSNIVTGNCDLPADTKTILKKTSSSSQEEYQTTPPDATEYPFVSQSESNFIMLYPQKATADERSVIDRLRNDIEKNIGCRVEIKADSDFIMTEENRKQPVILVGYTNYDESIAAVTEIKQKRPNHAADYIIRMIGNRLVIAAGSETGLKFAANFFMQNYCKNDESKIPVGLEYVSSDFNRVKNITLAGVDISLYKLVLSRFASYMEVTAANSFVEQMAKVTGAELTIIRDSSPITDAEIIIGSTSRNDSGHSVQTDSGISDNYNISVENGRTVVTGDSIAAINAGIMRLAANLATVDSFSIGHQITGCYDGEYSLANGYKLTWSDEFNGTALSKTWITTNQTNPSVYGGSCYSSVKNSYVKNGNLVQRINRSENDVMEADINSQGANTMKFKYGYLEFRIRLSPVKGSWGALWLLGNIGGYNYGEVDAFENFGKTNLVKSNLHIWGPGTNHENLLGDSGSILNFSPGTQTAEPFADNYHTVGFNWSKGRFDFYVDGACSQSYVYDPSDAKFGCYDNPLYLILSHWGGRDIPEFKYCILPDDFKEAEIYYDWIRIYQQDDNDSIMYIKQ